VGWLRSVAGRHTPRAQRRDQRARGIVCACSLCEGSVRWEAIIVSVFGATLGIVVGIPLGVSVSLALPNSFVTTTVIPFNTIVIILIASVVVGIFAAIFPARRAAKLDVLDAIATH
jgi:hypothetical protein